MKVDSIDSTEQINVINQSNDLHSGSELRRWYVIYTKPHSEDLARKQLEKKDISVFLPKICEVRFRTYKLQERIQPLFPNYLFARFIIPDEYFAVKWARGVRRIVGSGEVPIPVDDSVVIFLKGHANEKGIIQPKPNLKSGDKVRVRQGPFEGLSGIVHGTVNARGRVNVLMSILNSGTKVELPCSYVARYG